MQKAKEPIFNLPNSFSLLRAPFSIIFILEHTSLRLAMIFLAMFTDCMDGYLARRYRYTSRFGAILDPIMDKFFVYVAITVLLHNQSISIWGALAMLSRDMSLLLYILYLQIKEGQLQFEFRAIRWGKVTTAAQFLCLIALVLKIPFPPILYLSFLVFGILAFFELISRPTISDNTREFPFPKQ